MTIPALLALSCAGAAGQPSLPPARRAPDGGTSRCALAEAQRSRVSGLLAEGKLHRALRVIAHADWLCPESAPSSRAAKLGVLVELGLRDEAGALAQRIASRPDEPVSLRTAAAEATRALAEAARTGLPDGRALLQAGLEARARGAAASAQQLFDRAVVALEREQGASLAIDEPVTWSNVVGWSPDGRRLVVRHRRSTVVFDTRTWRPLRLLDDALGDLGDFVSFAPEGRMLVGTTFGDERHPGVVRTIDVDTGRVTHTFGPIPGAQFGLWPTWSPDRSIFAMNMSPSSVALWNARSGELLRILREGGPSQAAFSPDSKAVAVAVTRDEEQSVEIRRVDTGALVRRLGPYGHLRFVGGLEFAPSGELRIGVFGLGVGWIEIWDVARGRELRSGSVKELCGPSGDPALRKFGACIRFLGMRAERQGDPALRSPDGRYLLEPTRPLDDGFVVRERESGRPVGEILMPRPSVIAAMAIRPDGRALAAASDDGSVQVWNLDSGRLEVRAERRDLSRGDRHVWEVGWGRVEVGSLPRRARALAFQDRHLLFDDVRASPPIPALAVVRDGNGGTVRSFQGVLSSSLALRPDGRALAWASSDGIVVGDMRTGHRTQIATDDPKGLAFRPDGGAIASTTSDGKVRVIDVESKSVMGPIACFESGVSALALRSDGGVLACGGSEGVEIWDLARSTLIHRLDIGDAVTALAFHPRDRDLLFVGGKEGIVTFRLPGTAPVAKLQIFAAGRVGYVLGGGAIETLGSPTREYRRCHVGSVPLPFVACAERSEAAGLLRDLLSPTPSAREL